MKPNDSNGNLPPDQRPYRVLLIAGSDRRQWDCPGIDSKARALMFRMADQLPQDWEIDVEDLGNIYKREQIQTCNACVSTSMALCVWPCNCYEKNSWAQPDLMWNLDMYSRLDLADAWAIIGPVNWYSTSSNLKAMFDRLVCMNGGNPREELIGHKSPERAIALERTPLWEEISQNHLEGRSAAFFSYGDGGGTELDRTGRPKILHHKHWFDAEEEPFEDMRQAYAPVVWQCRYSGIEVPDALWTYCEFGRNKAYGDNQAEHMADTEGLYPAFDEWVGRFIDFVTVKGRVPPNQYRAFGHRAPSHFIADMKTKWRGVRMALGFPPAGTSPAIQQEQGLNRDRRILYKQGEGKRLRD